jgi:FkbM family methyltransferase
MKVDDILKFLKYPSLGYNIRDKIIILFSITIPRLMFGWIILISKKLYGKIGQVLYKCRLPFFLKIDNSIFYVRGAFDFFHLKPDYEREVTHLMTKITRGLKEGDIFIDVGAHIGKYSILLSSLNPKLKVVAIEGEKENFKALVRNIFLNKLQNRVIPINQVVWNKETVKIFYVDFTGSGCSTFFYSYKNYRRKFKKIKVRTIKLDKIIVNLGMDPNKIKLVKLDVEGSEYFALKGATRILRNKPIIIFESWNEENLKTISDFLKKWGYKAIKKVDEVNYLAL